MKTKISRISRRTVSIVLAMLMMVSMLIVGTISANANTVTNLNRVKFHADLSGYTGSGSSMNTWSNQSLTNADNNHYYGTFYTAANQSQKEFGWNVGGSNWGDSWCTMNGEHFTAITTYEKTKDMSFGGSNDKVSTIAAESGWVKLQIDWYGNYSNSSYVKFYQTKVSQISSSVSVGSSALNAGATTTVTSSSSGGTGTPTNSIKVCQGSASGSDVTSSVMSGTTFTAPNVATTTTYYITNTATDPKIGSYKVTSTAKTITVTPVHSVTRTAPSNGYLQLSTDNSTWGTRTLTVAEGANYYVKATPKTGYKISALNVGGSTIDAATGRTSAYTYTGTMGTSDVATSVTYTKRTFNVKKTETGGSGGTVKVGDTTIGTSNTPIEYGTNYTVTVAAPKGKKITVVSGISGTTSGLNTGSVTITGVSITAATTISVTYADAGTCAITAKKTNSSGAVLGSESMTIGNNMTVYAEGNAYHSSGNFSVSSSNSSVASVSSATVAPGNTFTVNAKSVGSATITISCSADGSSTSFTVSVGSSGFAIQKNDGNNHYVLKGDSTYTMTTNSPSGLDSVAWSTTASSSNFTINSSTGVINPKNTGTYSVTAVATFTNGGSESSTINVTVQEPTLSVNNGSLSLDYTSDSSNAGSDYHNTGTFTVSTNANNPAYADRTSVEVESLDTTVATVSKASITGTSSTVTVTAHKAGTTQITVKYKIGSTVVKTETINVTVTAYDVNMTVYATGSTAYWNSNCYFIPGSTGTGGTAMVKIGTASSKPVYALNITKKQFTDGFYFGTAAAISTDSNHNTTEITGNDTTKNFYTITDQSTWHSCTTAKSSVTITKPVITAKSNETVNAGSTKVATAPTVTGSVSSYKWTVEGTKASYSANTTSATPTISGSSAGSAAATVRAFIPLSNTGVTFSSLETSSSAAYDYIASNAQSFTITVQDVQHTVSVVAVSRDTSSGTYSTNASAMASHSVSPSSSVSHNSTATITATAANGYVLTGYYTAANNGSQLSGTNKNQITVTGDVTVYARFEQKYDLTFTSTNGTVSGTGYSSNKLTTYAGTKPSDLTVAVDTGYRIDWANSTNLSKYYNQPSTLVGTVTLEAKEAANINSADKVNTAVTIAYEAITPQVNFTSYKTTDGSTYTAGGGALTAEYSTGGGGVGGAGGASSYYIYYGGGDNPASNGTEVNVTTNGDGTYTGSFSWNTGSNFYALITTSTTNEASRKSNSCLHASNTTTVTLQGNVNSSETLPVDRSSVKVLMCYVTSNSTVYVTYNPTNDTVLVSSNAYTPAGGGGGSSSSGAVTNGGTVPYGADVTFTAPDTYTSSGDTYKFIGWYSTQQPANNETALGTNLTYTKSNVIDDVNVYARYNKVYSVTLYNTYSEEGSAATGKDYKYLTSPPNKVEITRGSETITYTYKFGTLGDYTQRGYEHTVSIDGGNYYEGNKIPVLAGEKIKLCYTALASSDTITSVLFNNTTVESGNTVERHYTVEDATNNPVHDDWDYTYESNTCLWADANYYPDNATTINAQTYTAAVDNDSHTVEWNVTQDYLNVDLQLSEKKQITFPNEFNGEEINDGLDITSKNVDNYYSVNEDLSTNSSTGLKVVAATSSSCTYVIGTPKYYKKDGTDVTSTLTAAPYNFAYNSTTGKFTGKMPNYDVVVDMRVTTRYAIHLVSKMMADPIDSTKVAWSQVGKISADFSGSTTDITEFTNYTTTNSTTFDRTITKGDTITYTQTWYDANNGNTYKDNYLFLGWYKGDASGPDMVNGLLQKTRTPFTYTPKANTYVWAVGTRMMYIGGSFYINDGEQTYCEDADSNATWANNREEMTWDPAGNRYSYTFNTISTNKAYHFRVYEEASSADGDSGAQIWNRWAQANNKKYDYDFDGNTRTLDYGRYYVNGNDYNDGGWNNCGWFNVDTDVLNGGYNAPVTVYFYPDTGGIEVSATYQWKKIYVSSGLNGFETGATININNTSSTPNKTATVAAKAGTQLATGSKSWNPEGDYKGELHVQEYYVKTKNGTVTVSKEVSSGYKVAAFVVYEYDKHEVHSVDATEVEGVYKADIKITENSYIYPVIESTSADMTVYVNSSDLDTSKWGDLVSLYSWNTGDAPTNGPFPGQLMIPSSNGESWYANISSTNLSGITFSNNFKDMWLENQVHYDTVIPTYNSISGHNNVTAQTYDYREPKPLVDIAKNDITAGREDKVMLSFSLKDGNINLTSYNGTVTGGTYTGAGTVSSSFYSSYYNQKQTINPSDFDYLTNRDHSQYTDLNGTELGPNYKPTPSFYVICKGNTQYLNGVNQSKNEISYAAINTYSGKWSVDWFVYDAAGNYITSILSAGYADREGNNSTNLSRVAEAVHNAGYAFEDKAVGISYDFPQSYNDNSLYRFSGQWISTSSTTPVTLNVKVGMKLGEDEDGPIMQVSNSNSEAYGTASAEYVGTNRAIEEAADHVTIKLSDASNKPVQVTSTNENNTFIGWYTYDKETKTYDKIPGSALTFKPTFDQNTTIYAIYEAKAQYRFKYTGRESVNGTYDKYYTVEASNLTPNEVANGNKPSTSTELENGMTRLEEAASLAPSNTQISVFKKTATVNSSTCTSSAYTLTFDCTTTADNYTLTYYYYKGTGGTNWGSATATGIYNEGIDISQETKTQVVLNAPSGKKFVGWYDSQNGGKLLSKQANFGMALSENTTIYAHYENLDYTSTYDATPLCEENTLTKEMYSPDKGNYYNDFLCKFQKSDGTPQTASNCGILIIYQDDINAEFGGSSITETNYRSALRIIGSESGKAARSTAKNSILLNIKANELSIFSRVDLVFKSACPEYTGRDYYAVPYVYENGTYTFGTRIGPHTYN